MVNRPATLTDSTPTNRAAERSPNNGFISCFVSRDHQRPTFEITFLAPGVEAYVFTFG
jgi:hypothetical protein